MMSKTKIALIAAIAMASIASPVLAQTATSQYRTYRSERFYNQAPRDQENYDWNSQQGQGGSDY
jgi:hypothetical protein